MAIFQTYPDAADPFRERSDAHDGLNFAYGAGRVRSGTTISDTAAGTVLLDDDDTSYVEVNPADGTVGENTIGWTAGSIPLFEVATAGGAITTVTDKRGFLQDTEAGSGLLTTKGDLLVYTTAEARIGVGADTHVLTADAAQASGIRWAAAAAAAHDLGGAAHTADSLADLNTKISDAVLTGKHITLNTQEDAYTLVLTDDGKLIDISHADPKILTVPKNSAVAFPTGTQILVRQKGAGQVTIAPVDGDVTLNSAGPALKTVAQYSVAGLIKVAENVWACFGDLEA